MASWGCTRAKLSASQVSLNQFPSGLRSPHSSPVSTLYCERPSVSGCQGPERGLQGEAAALLRPPEELEASTASVLQVYASVLLQLFARLSAWLWPLRSTCAVHCCVGNQQMIQYRP